MAKISAWKTVGEGVGRLIRKKGYRSVELFAHENGIDKSVLNRLIKGEREVRLSTFLKILDGLEIPLTGLEVTTAGGQGATGVEKKRILIENRTIRISTSDVDRIEIRKSERDRKPLMVQFSKSGKMQILGWDSVS